MPQRHGGALNSGGTPGNVGGPGRPDAAFRYRARYWLEEAKALQVTAHIVSGDILEVLGTRLGQLVIGNTKNADRLHAVEILRDSAGFGPKQIIVGPDASHIEFTIKLRDDGD